MNLRKIYMIILNKDKPQKNEYIFLDDLEKIASINKKKVIVEIPF